MTTAPKLEYRSRGALLICGDQAALDRVLDRLPAGQRGLAVITDTPAEGRHEELRLIPGRIARIEGHLGVFRAWAIGHSEDLDLGPLSPNDDGLFDLVLDLSPRPFIGREVPPPGYLAPARPGETLESCLQALPELTGSLYKPRWFHYRPERCAHDRQQVAGCDRCLDACPANAIRPLDAGVEVNPWLCQGCGSCALTCPGGALSPTRPTPNEALVLIAGALAERKPGSTLLLHQGPAGPDLPVSAATLVVERIGAWGPETWLGGLALGAGRVVLHLPGDLPATTTRVLEEQVGLTRRLLRGLGLGEERIRFTHDLEGIDWEGLPSPCPTLTLGGDDKRSLMERALDHLGKYAQSKVFPLPPGSPFGTLAVDAEACTRCRACIGLCPTHALRPRTDDGIDFNESLCLQCGLCVHACPERVIALQPRWQPDTQARTRPGLWVPADEPFHCTHCGAPFANRRLVASAIAQVRDNPHLQGRDLDLLSLCMACRQKAMTGRLDVELIDRVE